jgi:hypothetical protein
MQCEKVWAVWEIASVLFVFIQRQRRKSFELGRDILLQGISDEGRDGESRDDHDPRPLIVRCAVWWNAGCNRILEKGT